VTAKHGFNSYTDINALICLAFAILYFLLGGGLEAFRSFNYRNPQMAFDDKTEAAADEFNERRNEVLENSVVH